MLVEEELAQNPQIIVLVTVLMDIEEFGDYDNDRATAFYKGLVKQLKEDLTRRPEGHVGDCVNAPTTCPRCLVEERVKVAKEFLKGLGSFGYFLGS